MKGISHLASETPPIHLYDPMGDFDELCARYAHVTSHVENAQQDSLLPLTESQLWNLVARVHSPPWAEANSRLQTAELHMRIFCNRDNRPLGAIGAALASEDITRLESALMRAQAQFTLVDEQLRQDADLMRLTRGLVMRYAAIEESLGLSQSVAALNENMQDILGDGDDLPSPLARAFTSLARRLFKTPEAASAAPAAPVKIP